MTTDHSTSDRWTGPQGPNSAGLNPERSPRRGPGPDTGANSSFQDRQSSRQIRWNAPASNPHPRQTVRRETTGPVLGVTVDMKAKKGEPLEVAVANPWPTSSE